MRKVLFFIGMILFLVGCSAPYRESPVAVNFKTQDQQKLQALSHWKIIADDLSSQLHLAKNKNIFIKISSDTEFNKMFGTFFRSSLIKKGYKVVLDPNKADYIIEYNSNLVEFKDRYIPKNRDLVGSLVLLSSGVAVLRDATIASGTVVGVGALEALNIYASKRAYNGASIYELGIDINVLDPKKRTFVNEINGIYYIVDNQKCLYKKCEEGVTFYLKGE